MFRKKKILKAIAIFLLLNMLNYVFGPTVTYALTSGPTTPETSSFEPVDTSNMVNLNTGDFVYNLPLLEVPGPAGSYPLSLSYHAGIPPTEEASWVGLGWNVNPGAIMRSNNGYPDDWKNAISYQQESWVGGKTDRVTAGLSASIFGITFSGGIIQTQDTYKGSGTGGYTGVSYGYGDGDGLSASAGITAVNDPVNGSSISLHSSIGYSANSYGVGLGSSSTFTMSGSSSNLNFTGSANGVSASTDGNNLSITALGTTIATSGEGFDLKSVLGVPIKKTHLHTAGRIQSVTSSNLSTFTDVVLAIHSPLFKYKDERTKYSIKEGQIDWVNGALYNDPNQDFVSYFDNRDYDVYDMFEVEDNQNPATEINYPKYGVGNQMMMGGTLPAYDGYVVMGQGTGGAMQPYDFLSTLYRQNKKNNFDNYITKQYIDDMTDQPPAEAKAEFMFSGEFSNKYLYDLTSETVNPFTYSYDETNIESDPAKDIEIHDNKLGRASNIEWFTNGEISSGTAYNKGLIFPENHTIKSGLDDQIGAFMVTNPSGVTYHYALPAYSYEEEYYTENIAVDVGKNGDYKTIINRNTPYAYTWHLTAVTGPDYVDRGTKGLDEDDWGYWIEFNYGKWASDYKWRTPETGFKEDLDANFRNYSSGKKELYYLNSIRSATHTAIFIKDVRKDGKGLAENDRDATFSPTACTKKYPVSTLKLSKIVLIENKDLPDIDYSYNNSYGTIPGCGGSIEVHHGDNILLSENLTGAQKNALQQHQIKSAKFNTDYSIMPETANSFSNDNLYTSSPATPDRLYGKLTLNSVRFSGKKGISLLPPITFDYKDKEEPYCRDCVDYWGSYKSDYDPTIKDVNFKKMPSSESAAKVDTWSLNKITTSLGARINVQYGSDDYNESVLYNNVNIPISNVETSSNNIGNYKVYLEELEGQLSNYFSIDQEIKTFIATSEAEQQHFNFERAPVAGVPLGGCAGVDYFKVNDVETYENTGNITAIGTDYLEIQVDDPSKSIQHDIPYYYKSSTRSAPVNDISTTALDVQPDQNAVYPCQLTTYYTEEFKDFIGGEIITEMMDNKIGGGIRVEKIAVEDNIDNATYSTLYDYTQPNSNQSSGVTTYIPYKINNFKIEYPDRYKNTLEGYFSGHERRNGGIFTDMFKNWREFIKTLLLTSTIEKIAEDLNIIKNPDRNDMSAFIYSGLSTKNDFVRYKRSALMGDLLSKIREVPSAGVVYQYVTVKEMITRDGETIEGNNYAVNEFITYDNSMVSVETSQPKENPSGISNPDGSVISRGVTINNLGSAAGQPKSIKIFDKNNNLLTEKIYHYLHEQNNPTDNVLDGYMGKISDKFDKQGVIDEVSLNNRYVPNDIEYIDEEDDDGNIIETDVYKHDLLGVITKRRTYPVIKIAEENINYRNGSVTSSANLAFDFYSGSVTEILQDDGSGSKYVTVSIPAYKASLSDGTKVYPGMGLSMNGGDNMLTQEAASATYKINESFNHVTDNNYTITGLVGSSVQTWSDEVRNLSNNWAPCTVSGNGSDPNSWSMDADSELFEFDDQIVVRANDNRLRFYIDWYANGEYKIIPMTEFDPSLIFSNSAGKVKLDQPYKKHKNYVWIGDDNLNADGTYPYDPNMVSDKSWWQYGIEPTSGKWQKNSEITLYDYNSNALEAKDLNGDFAATKMNMDQTKVFASVSNATYEEFVYSGAEDDPEDPTQFGGGIVKGTATVYSTDDGYTPHSGKYVLATSNGSKAFIYTTDQLKDRIYHASTWTNSPDGKIYYSIDGGTEQYIETDITKKAGDWYLIKGNITGVSEGSSIEIGVTNATGNEVLFDDFRFHPMDASMTSYVYNQWGELSHTLDDNNLYTHYHYDEMGRLKKVTRERLGKGEVVVSESDYNYARK